MLATDLPPEVLEDWYVHVGEMLLARTRAIFDAPWTDLGKIEHG